MPCNETYESQLQTTALNIQILKLLMLRAASKTICTDLYKQSSTALTLSVDKFASKGQILSPCYYTMKWYYSMNLQW